MALKFKTRTAKSVSYGSKRSTNAIKYIVLHYTGGAKDTAKNNVDFFATGNTRSAGAHYFIDDGGIVWKSVPVNRVAWAVGGFYTSSNGAAKYYRACTNSNSLSIEMAGVANGVPEKTYQTAVELTKFLMKKYNIPQSNIIRHWDTNGKQCPEPWIGKNNPQWIRFKKDIASTSTAKPSKKVNSSSSAYDVRVTASALNIRKSANVESTKIGMYPRGTIVTIKAVKNGWGQTNKGWIKLEYTKKC